MRQCITDISLSNKSSTGEKEGKVTTVVATPGHGQETQQQVSYTDTKVIGNGSFGVVYQARLADTNEMVAIKKVLQDKRFKVIKCRYANLWSGMKLHISRLPVNIYIITDY